MLIFYHNINPLSSFYYKRGNLSFLLLYKNFLTLYKPSTLSYLVMSPWVMLCLSNTQVLVYYLVAVWGICYLSWLFTYISIFIILSYTPLNFHQSILSLTSIFGSKVPLSLSTLLLITNGLSLFGNNGTTPISTVYNRQVRIIDNWLAHSYEWLIMATWAISCYNCWLTELASHCSCLEPCLYSSSCLCSYLYTQTP